MSHRTVLIIYAGGTIGMVPSANGFVPSARFADDIGMLIVKHHSSVAHHRLITLDPLIDSANASPHTWHRLADLLWAERDHFDAAVILHGTDTLAYTASALSFLLAGLNKAVILTGAQIPFAMPASDGERNLQGAFACATTPVREVCIFFDGALLRGNRARKWSTEPGDGFHSPHWPRLAQVNGSIAVNTAALLPPTTPRRDPPPAIGTARAAIVTLFPGIDASLLRAAADHHRAGLVLALYGAGTGPAADPAIRRSLMAISADRIPLLGISQCPHGTLNPALYETGRQLADCGVIDGRDLTPEAALAKLHTLSCRQHSEVDLATAIAVPVAGELTPANGT